MNSTIEYDLSITHQQISSIMANATMKIEAFTDPEELFFSIALFLAPTDLVNLAQTCKLFVAAPLPPEAKKAKGKRRRKAPVKEWSTGDDASARQWSLIEEASRKRLSIPSGRVE